MRSQLSSDQQSHSLQERSLARVSPQGLVVKISAHYRHPAGSYETGGRLLVRGEEPSYGTDLSVARYHARNNYPQGCHSYRRSIVTGVVHKMVVGGTGTSESDEEGEEEEAGDDEDERIYLPSRGSAGGEEGVHGSCDHYHQNTTCWLRPFHSVGGNRESLQGEQNYQGAIRKKNNI